MSPHGASWGPIGPHGTSGKSFIRLVNISKDLQTGKELHLRRLVKTYRLLEVLLTTLKALKTCAPLRRSDKISHCTNVCRRSKDELLF